MKANVGRNALLFEGVLDEQTQLEPIQNALRAVLHDGGKAPIAADFSKVSYANSRGSVLWRKFLRDADIQIKYVNTPTWMIRQFNIVVGDFFLNRSYVETMYAPFHCVETQDNRNYILRLGTDIPVLQDYTDFTVPDRVEGGKKFEADFESSQYFSFISQNYKTFKEILQ